MTQPAVMAPGMETPGKHPQGSSGTPHPEEPVACALLGKTTTGLLLLVFFIYY